MKFFSKEFVKFSRKRRELFEKLIRSTNKGKIKPLYCIKSKSKSNREKCVENKIMEKMHNGIIKIIEIVK